MCVLATGITSLHMIKKVYPLHSLLRKAVYYSMFFLYLASLFLVPDLLNLKDLGYQEMIVTISILLITPHVINGIYSFLEWGKRKVIRLEEKWRTRKLSRKKISTQS